VGRPFQQRDALLGADAAQSALGVTEQGFNGLSRTSNQISSRPLGLVRSGQRADCPRVGGHSPYARASKISVHDAKGNAICINKVMLDVERPTGIKLNLDERRNAEGRGC
jgi:hypothetical protein